MNEQILFTTNDGLISNIDMLEKLHSIGAHDCDVLYIHTDMSFGLPAKGIKRKALLAALLEVLEALHVKTLVFPTFTFSFCNKEIYDIQNSKTPMGSLNEYVRLTGRGARTKDPLLSAYVLGEPLNLVEGLSNSSIGLGSNYDCLHHCGKPVKFLFFGADMRECFTYTHYLEAIHKSPYRYDRSFEGTIIDNGVATPNTKVFLFSTYANCRLNSIPVVYNAMLAKGQLSQTSIGNSNFCCFNELDSYETITQLLTDNPYCLTDGTYDPSIQDISYPEHEKIVSVR